MTAHQDVAGLVAELRQQSRNRTEHSGNDAAKVTVEWRAATLIESLSQALREAEKERDRLNKRLDLLAVGFNVPDGGRYIADWQTKIDKFKADTNPKDTGA